MVTLKIQSILAGQAPAALDKFLTSLADNHLPEGQAGIVHLGDTAPSRQLSEEAAARWSEIFEEKGIVFRYTCLGEGYNFARGHNHLYFSGEQADRLLVLTPDMIAPFHLLQRLNRLAANRPGWGAVEAREVPLDRPKEFNCATLEAPALTNPGALLNGAAFRAAGGFDELFDSYGAMLDLGWRLRAAGSKLYYGFDTFIFYPRAVDPDGFVQNPAEKLAFSLDRLLLWSKYARPDLVANFLAAQDGPDLELLPEIRQAWEGVKDRLVPAGAGPSEMAGFDAEGYPFFNWPKSEEPYRVYGNRLTAGEEKISRPADPAGTARTTCGQKLAELLKESGIERGNLLIIGPGLAGELDGLEQAGLTGQELELKNGNFDPAALGKRLDRLQPVAAICLAVSGPVKKLLPFLAEYARAKALPPLFLVAPNLTHQDIAAKILGGRGLEQHSLQRYASPEDLAGLVAGSGWEVARTARVVNARSGQYDHSLLLHKATLAGEALRRLGKIFNSQAQVEYFIWQLKPAAAPEQSEPEQAQPEQACYYLDETFPERAAPKISVLIRTQGKRNELLTEALYSIYAQDCRPEDYEVVIALQTPANDREPFEQFKALLQNFPPPLKRQTRIIRIIGDGRIQPYNPLLEQARGEPGRDLDGPYNPLLKEATGGYFFYLDDDDMLLSNYFTVLLAAIEDCGPEAPLFHSYAVRRTLKIGDWQALLAPESRETAGFSGLLNDPDLPAKTYPYYTGETVQYWNKPYQPVYQYYNNELPICNYVIPRALLQQTGLRYDPEVLAYADWEFLMRVTAVLKVVTLPVFTTCVNIRDNNSQMVGNSELTRLWQSFYDKCVLLRESQPLLLQGEAVREIVAIFRRMEELGNQSHRLGTELHLARTELNYWKELARQQDAAYQDTFQSLNHTVTQTQEQVRQLQAYNRSLEEAVSGMRQSLSWKLTEPVRKATSLLTKLKKG